MAAELRNSPIIGVGAVILDERGRIVLVRRDAAPRQGEWSIPGGKIEWGETVSAALLREIREETGLDVEILQFIDVIDFVSLDAAGVVERHYVLLDFWARAIGGELTAGDDAAEARWVLPAELDRYALWSETRRVIDVALRCYPGSTPAVAT